MELQVIVDRLTAEVPVLRKVGFLIEVDTDKPVSQVPAAFVLALGDTADANRIASGSHRQILSEALGVVLIQRHANGADKVAVDFEGLKDTVRNALIGWSPADGMTALDYTGGALVDVKSGGEVWWLQRYELRREVKRQR